MHIKLRALVVHSERYHKNKDYEYLRRIAKRYAHWHNNNWSRFAQCTFKFVIGANYAFLYDFHERLSYGMSMDCISCMRRYDISRLSRKRRSFSVWNAYRNEFFRAPMCINCRNPTDRCTECFKHIGLNHQHLILYQRKKVKGHHLIRRYHKKCWNKDKNKCLDYPFL